MELSTRDHRLKCVDRDSESNTDAADPAAPALQPPPSCHSISSSLRSLRSSYDKITMSSASPTSDTHRRKRVRHWTALDRAKHSGIEASRRQAFNERLQTLAALLPSLQDEVQKGTVLSKHVAVDESVKELERLAVEVRNLKAEVAVLQSQQGREVGPSTLELGAATGTGTVVDLDAILGQQVIPAPRLPIDNALPTTPYPPVLDLAHWGFAGTDFHALTTQQLDLWNSSGADTRDTTGLMLDRTLQGSEREAAALATFLDDFLER